MSTTRVQIVDQQNNAVGAMEMKHAHSYGLIHRFVRVFLFNSNGELFLQRRSHKVLTFRGLWDQSAGGHVDDGEDTLATGLREMREEIGLDDVELQEVGVYYSEDHAATGHLKRFNTLYKAVSDKPLTFDAEEVTGGMWVTLGKLEKLIKDKPGDFTPGLIRALEFYKESLNK